MNGEKNNPASDQTLSLELPAQKPPAKAPVETLETKPNVHRDMPVGMEETLDAKAPSGTEDTLHADQTPPLRFPHAARDTATLSNAGGALPIGYHGLAEQAIPETMDEAPAALPLTLMERFSEVQFLGRGGMGAVYRATDKRLGRDVALKILFGGGENSTLLMLREARAQARFTHENVCKVYEVGVAEGQRYIMMQFIQGEPLDKAKPEMSLEEKVGIIRVIASALHEAHRIGLIHRDVKPSNIMVEQTEDGRFKPYLMDFGLAREMGGGDHATRTGVIAGTPAYMSPEQALGHVRSLDRRSDVYSLGATLYELLCDKPPFMDANMFRLLQRIAHEECVPLRKVAPSIPEDLEIVVAKCLEKEPARRYDSAKALGDDLQRFLDGEPILARKNSWGYIALKKLRRHKGKAALAMVALTASLSLSIAWAQEKNKAKLRETTARELGRELGEDVKEMELFLRSAYTLPLHNIERERKLVRERLLEIEARIAEAGHGAEGPGHYALGRGYAALEEYEKSLEHLRKSEAVGYAAPGLDYSLGLVLGELYKKALEETRRIENAEKKKAAIATLETKFKAPALKHLKAALGAKIELPAYAEGLIALYEGRNDDARRLAKEAFEQAPWLFEAKKLEGDAFFAEGSAYRNDAAFDHAKMKPLFEQASAAYKESADIARSHAGVYAAICELSIQTMWASHSHPEDLEPNFERAKQACSMAVAASPQTGSFRIKQAFVCNTYLWQMMAWKPDAHEIQGLLDEAISRGVEVQRMLPDEAMAHYTAAAAWRTKALYMRERGLDAAEAIKQALQAYAEAAARDPTFLWAYNEWCSTWMLQSRQELWQGKDPLHSVEEAVQQCRRALELDPTFIHAYVNLSLAHGGHIRYLIDKGLSPEKPIQAALKALEEASRQSTTAPGPIYNLGATYLMQLAYEESAGIDYTASLSRAKAAISQLREQIPNAVITRELEGKLALFEAGGRLRRHEDPEPFLKELKTVLEAALRESPWDMNLRMPLVEGHILGLRWALQEKKVTAAQLDEAFALLLPFTDQERALPSFYQSLAELHALKAEWIAQKKQKGWSGEISQGLAMADKALSLHPTMALGFLAKGKLWLVQANHERDALKRAHATSSAKEALEAAVRANALLQRDVKPLLASLKL